jgi:hypothetical protein
MSDACDPVMFSPSDREDRFSRCYVVMREKCFLFTFVSW